MSRPPALTPQQQEAVKQRLAAGEGVRALAREYGVGTATIRRQAAHTAQVRNVAEKVAAAQTALAELPPAQQHQALTLAERLRGISDHLTNAAYHGAVVASRLGEMAGAELAKLPKGAPLEKQHDTLKNVAALGRMANEAASLPMALVNAQKEQVKKANAVPMETRTLDTSKLSSAALRELMQARGG